MTIDNLKLSRRTAVALMALAASRASWAAYPERVMRIISPLAAGGTSDFVCRLIAERFRATFNQPCIVENKPGAASILGVDYVAKSAGDGYTIAYVTASSAIQPALVRLPYDLERDLQPISMVARVPYVMAARPESPYNSLDDVLAAARRGVSVSYGTFGTGSAPHMIMELIASHTGARFLHVPYKTSGTQLVDLLGGSIDVMWEPAPNVMGHIRGGKLKALATSGSTPLAMLPQVRALGQTVPGVEVIGWGALMAPASVPKSAIALLQQATAAAVVHPDVEPKLREQGFVPVGSTSEELGKVIKQEIALWSKLVQERNIKVN